MDEIIGVKPFSLKLFCKTRRIVDIEKCPCLDGVAHQGNHIPAQQRFPLYRDAASASAVKKDGYNQREAEQNTKSIRHVRRYHEDLDLHSI